MNHIRNGFTFFAVGLLAALFVGFRALNWVLAKWGRSWGIEGPEDWASLAAMLLILEILIFISMPIENGYSRMQEHNADVYGLEVIHGIVPNSPEVAAHSFQILGEIGLGRSESAGADYILAVFASAAGAAAGVCAHL